MNRSMRGCPGATRMLHRRKRGGRKRLFVPVRANRLLPSKSLTRKSCVSIYLFIYDACSYELSQGDGLNVYTEAIYVSVCLCIVIKTFHPVQQTFTHTLQLTVSPWKVY